MKRKVLLAVLCVIAVVTASIGVQAAAPIFGDLNGDGAVNATDVVILARHVAGWKGYETIPLGGTVSTEPTFVVDKVSAQAGQENVEVKVSLKNNPGVSSLVLDVNFDESVLTLTNVSYNASVVTGGLLPQKHTSPVRLYWTPGTYDVTGDFEFATLTFSVSGTAAKGTSTDIGITYNPDDVYNLAEDNIDFDVEIGKVTIN